MSTLSGDFLELILDSLECCCANDANARQFKNGVESHAPMSDAEPVIDMVERSRSRDNEETENADPKENEAKIQEWPAGKSE